MERNSYIELRKAKEDLAIIYQFCKERGMSLSPQQFTSYLQAYVTVTMVDLRPIMESILDHYDTKFGLTLVQQLKEFETISEAGEKTKGVREILINIY